MRDPGAARAQERRHRRNRRLAGRRAVAGLAFLAFVFDTIARLIGAIALAFVALALIRSRPPALRAAVLRWTIALAAFAGALWTVFACVPNAPLASATFAGVATGVLVAGLAADELIGADVRRLLRLRER